jgi:hypothetical protein
VGIKKERREGELKSSKKDGTSGTSNLHCGTCSLGPVHFDAKKNLIKFWQLCPKIWQQTKCSHFFCNFTKIWYGFFWHQNEQALKAFLVYVAHEERQIQVTHC